MKPTIFIRNGHIITDTRSNQARAFKGTNQAKRESHKLQMENDEALGRGTVRRTV